MKNLKLTFLLSLINYFAFGQNIQNSLSESLALYPIRYDDGMDIFIKTEFENDGEIHLIYNELDKTNYKETVISKNQASLNKLNLNSTYELQFYAIYENEKVYLNEKPIFVNSNFDDLIEVSFALNKKINEYVSVKDQSIPFDEYLTSIIDNKTIYKEEAISYAQQFYFEYNNTVQRSKDALESIFESYKRDGEKSGCKCNYILNHSRSLAPHNGLNNSTGEYTIKQTENFYSSSPKPHMVMTLEKGPAHFKYLYMKGKNGGHRHQYTTLGVDNLNTNGAPNYAQMTYNLNCQNYLLVPKACGCTKFLQIKYRYDVKMQLHTPNLPFFWSDGREAGVEEFAVLMANSAFGTHVLDAGRAKMHNKCNSDWNLDWFSSLGNLATDALNLAIGITSANGGVLDTIAGQAGGIISSIINLAATPIVNTTGSCNDGTTIGTLMEGTNLYLLKPNEPTTFVMTSHTYLGGRGYGSWKIQAHSHSDFAMSAVILGPAIAEEGFFKPAEWCCTDKVGSYVLGSVGSAPLSESNLHGYVGSHIGSWGPWNNINYNPFTNLPTLPGKNLGWLLYNDPRDKCAPTQGAKKEIDYQISLNDEVVEPNLYLTDEALKNSEIMNNVNLDDYDPSIEISMFPNPTVSEINFTINSPIEREIEIYIYNSAGARVALPFIGVIPNGTLTIPYTLSEKLTSGVYFVQIQSGENVLSLNKFFKK